MRSCRCFPHVGKMSNLRYNRTIALPLHIFNRGDVEVIICLILVLLTRDTDLNHHLNIRQYARPPI